MKIPPKKKKKEKEKENGKNEIFRFYELFRLSPKGNNFNGHEMKSKT